MLRPQRKAWIMSFANGGEEALAELQRTPYDVIVTDMRMPGIDGARLLELVQERYPSVVRIVLSGHVEMEAAFRAAPVAHQFLSKPCDPVKLRETIERACNCRAALPYERIRQIIGSIGPLPTMPATCASLLAALQDPDIDLARVGRIIEQDVGMAAKILQLVNSAFFARRDEVTSIRIAVSYLGFEILTQLVLTVEIFRTFQPAHLEGFSLSEFEAHSQLAAQIARWLPAPASTAPDGTVAALLHDVGKLVLASRLPGHLQMALRTASERGVPLYRVEEELSGISHAEVGGYLLDLWGLPKSIVDAVRGHHKPRMAQSQGSDLNILAVTHISDALAHEARDAPQFGTPVGVLDADYVSTIGMADQLPAWRKAAEQFAREAV